MARADLLLNFSVAAINVNSIVTYHRRFELLEFLKKHNHDIVFLSETKLIERHKLQFKNYNIIRTNRPNSIQGGGTAVVIKKYIQFEIVNYPLLIMRYWNIQY